MSSIVRWIPLATIVLIGGSRISGSEPVAEPRFEALPGKTVGLLVLDSETLAAREGRTGPQEAVVFVPVSGSFRWIYLPAQGDSDADDLSFGLSPDGKSQRTFHHVKLATQDLIRPLGLTGPFHLVQVEVNGGEGSAAEESFVATTMKRLDGTDEYPWKPSEVLRAATDQAHKYFADEKEAIGQAMASTRNQIAKGRKPTGPEETIENTRVSWIPDTQRLRIEVQLRRTNGFYVSGQGVDGPDGKTTRSGTQFGAIGEMMFDIGNDGQVVRATPSKVRSFIHELAPPPTAN